MHVVRRRLVVSGRVQGVSYRWYCREQAELLGLAGWVRNQPDGSVEVVAEGDPTAVDQLVRWCGAGPRHAVVTGVTVDDEPVAGETGFTIRR